METAASRFEAALERIEAALERGEDDGDSQSDTGKGGGFGHFQGGTTRQGKGYGNYGGTRGNAWYEKKNRRAELHQSGMQPPRTSQTKMCWNCKRNQPSTYCSHELCRNCCVLGVWNGWPCRYHALMAEM